MSEFRTAYSVFREPGAMAKEFKELELPLQERKAKFLEYLTEYISKLEHIAKLEKLMSDSRERAEAKCSGVPEASRLDRMIRYEAALERAFDRTLNQLERLQRMRLGKPVPPPINVNISNS